MYYRRGRTATRGRAGREGCTLRRLSLLNAFMVDLLRDSTSEGTFLRCLPAFAAQSHHSSTRERSVALKPSPTSRGIEAMDVPLANPTH